MYVYVYMYILCILHVIHVYLIYMNILIYFSRCNADIFTYFSHIICAYICVFSLKYLHYIWRNNVVFTLLKFSTFPCTFP